MLGFLSVSVVPLTASCARFHSPGLTKPSGVRCCHLPPVQEQKKKKKKTLPGSPILVPGFSDLSLGNLHLGKDNGVTDAPFRKCLHGCVSNDRTRKLDLEELFPTLPGICPLHLALPYFQPLSHTHSPSLTSANANNCSNCCSIFIPAASKNR